MTHFVALVYHGTDCVITLLHWEAYHNIENDMVPIFVAGFLRESNDLQVSGYFLFRLDTPGSLIQEALDHLWSHVTPSKRCLCRDLQGVVT